MAAAAPVSVPTSAETPFTSKPNRVTVKSLVESFGTNDVPAGYLDKLNPAEWNACEPEEAIPVIDYSLLTSTDPDQHSKAIQDLGKACEEWGFFLVVNHGVPESLIKETIDACSEFFDQPDEEKLKYQDKDPWNPVRFGTGVHIQMENFFLWRDYLKCFVNPTFNFFEKPEGFSEIAKEYSKRTHDVATELLKGISESLGLEPDYINNVTNFKSGLEIFSSSVYPPCPKPECAIGLPPHSDHGLVTVLVQNGIGGLQVWHNEKWTTVDPLPNSFMVHTCDQLEILTNGKIKSRFHKAVVNNKAKRISIAMGNGPGLDTVISPAPEFVDETHPPTFVPMTFKEYVNIQQSSLLRGKPMLDHVRIEPTPSS